MSKKLKDMYSPKQALNNIKYHYFNGQREYNDIEVEKFWFERAEHTLKALEIIKEKFTLTDSVNGLLIRQTRPTTKEESDLLKEVFRDE